jgi:hypothetical protein
MNRVQKYKIFNILFPVFTYREGTLDNSLVDLIVVVLEG